MPMRVGFMPTCSSVRSAPGVIDAATIIRHENRTLGSFARVADSAALLAEGLGAGSGA